MDKREGKEQGAGKNDSMRKKNKSKRMGFAGYVARTKETNIYKPGVNKPRKSISHGGA